MVTRAVHPDARPLEIAGTPSRSWPTRHEQGLQVNVWTVNDGRQIERLADAGVDAVITDVPDVARRALGLS